MQIELQPENLVLMFQNSEWLYNKYCLIRVLAEYDMFNLVMKGLKDPVPRITYNKNLTGIVIAVDSTHKMILENGSTCEIIQSGSKRECVLNAIDSRIVDRGCAYLYLHEGVTLGFYDFRDKKFTPFLNNDDAHALMHQFFYKMMTLPDKRTLPVSFVKQMQIEKDVVEYCNGYSDDRECDDDSVIDDDSDSDSEEEIHIVIQTAPVQKKKLKSMKSVKLLL